MSTPRKHHIVPEFFLARFTQSGRRSGRLWVLDKADSRLFPSTPRKAARERDFYKIDVAGADPAGAEKALSDIESRAAIILRNLAETESLPNGDDLDVLVVFVTLMDIRGRTFRKSYDNFEREITRQRLRMLTGSPKLFQAWKNEMKERGEDVSALDFREAREFVRDESRYSIEVPREASVKRMLEMLSELYPYYRERKWTLAISDGDARDFCTSDRPVLLEPKNPKIPFVGHGPASSNIIMPVGRRMALLGHTEHILKGIVRIDDTLVSQVNEDHYHQCERFLYLSSEPEALV